ncbi:MAG: lysine biosynthesis protein LysW [Candidatus Bathyarchaeia archaeon]
MPKVTCPDCLAEIDVPDDVMVGEIVSCPDCGLDLEVEKVEGQTIELQKLAIEKEDWGQ